MFSVNKYTINVLIYLFITVLAAISFVISAIIVTGVALGDHGLIKFDQIVYSQRSNLYSEYRVTTDGELNNNMYYFCGLPNLTSNVKHTNYTYNAKTQYGKFDYISFYLQSNTSVKFDISLEYNENGTVSPTGISEDVVFYFLDHNNFISFRNGRGFETAGASYTGKDSNFSVSIDQISWYGEYYAIIGAGYVEGRIKVNSHKKVNKWVYSDWKIDINRTFLDTSNSIQQYSNLRKCSFSTSKCDLPVVIVQIHDADDFKDDGPYSLNPVTYVNLFMKFKTGHQVWIFGVPILICSAIFVFAIIKAYKEISQDKTPTNVGNLRAIPSIMSVYAQFSARDLEGHNGNDYTGMSNFPTLDTPEDSLMEQPLLEKAKEFGQSLVNEEMPVSGIGILSRSASSTMLRGECSISPRSPMVNPSIRIVDNSNNSSSTSSSSPGSVKVVPGIRPVGGTVSYSVISSINPEETITSSYPRQRPNSPFKNVPDKSNRNRRDYGRKN